MHISFSTYVFNQIKQGALHLTPYTD